MFRIDKREKSEAAKWIWRFCGNNPKTVYISTPSPAYCTSFCYGACESCQKYKAIFRNWNPRYMWRNGSAQVLDFSWSHERVHLPSKYLIQDSVSPSRDLSSSSSSLRSRFSIFRDANGFFSSLSSLLTRCEFLSRGIVHANHNKKAVFDYLTSMWRCFQKYKKSDWARNFSRKMKRTYARTEYCEMALRED